MVDICVYICYHFEDNQCLDALYICEYHIYHHNINTTFNGNSQHSHINVILFSPNIERTICQARQLTPNKQPLQLFFTRY